MSLAKVPCFPGQLSCRDIDLNSQKKIILNKPIKKDQKLDLIYLGRSQSEPRVNTSNFLLLN